MSTDVKPYTDEDVACIREYRRLLAEAGADLSDDIIARWLATLDEQARERDEAERRCVGCVTREEDDAREVAALREELAGWHEAYREVCTAVVPHLGPPVGDKPLPRGVVEAAQALAGVVVSLREEVARLRRQHDVDCAGHPDVEARATQAFHEGRASALAAVARADEALAAAERRAEEARGAALTEAAALVRARRAKLAADRRAGDRQRTATVADGIDAIDAILTVLARSIDALATHPPQQQTPAPADRCSPCPECGRALALPDDDEARPGEDADGWPTGALGALLDGYLGLASDVGRHDHTVDDLVHAARDEIERLRSRVRELEGHLAAVLALVAENLSDDLDAYDKRTAAARAALPSQEQPAAPPTSTPEAPRATIVNADGEEETLTEEGRRIVDAYERLLAARSTPEGEPADDDADPSRWEPGDVAAHGEDSGWVLDSRFAGSASEAAGWWVHDADRPGDRRTGFIADADLWREGWRRISRSSEAGTGEAADG